MKIKLLLLLIVTSTLLAACQTMPKVTDFDSCVEAGNAVMESYPRQCRHNEETFVEVIEDTQVDAGLCIDSCGNAICEEMVCMGEGCPCAETASSCPADCS